MATTEGLLLHPAGRSALPLLSSSPSASSPSTPFPRMAYLFACTVGTRVLRVHTHATHLRMHACVRARARDACMRACTSCIYASMPVVPNPLTCSGQCPEFKDEGSNRWILMVKFSIAITSCRISVIRIWSNLFDSERRGLRVDVERSVAKFRRGNNKAQFVSSSNSFISDSWFTMWNAFRKELSQI